MLKHSTPVEIVRQLRNIRAMSAASDINVRTLAWDLFRDAADEDYLAARWAIKLGLTRQYWWSASQAVEKYLKCALLLNGVSVKDYSHDLPRLFARAKLIFDDLIPDAFLPPQGFPFIQPFGARWAEPTDKIIERIGYRGTPDNRYRYFSITTNSYDLHKLDEVCFWLRRLSHPLEMKSSAGKPYRELLRSDPNYQIHKTLGPLKKKTAPSYSERRSILCWRNFSFFPEGAYHLGEICNSGSAENSAIYLTIQRGDAAKPALRWLIDNVHLRKADAAEIRKML